MKIYRFQDKVAINPPNPEAEHGTSPTFYLTPNDARTVAAALRRAANEIEAVRFSKSTVGDTNIETKGSR